METLSYTEKTVLVNKRIMDDLLRIRELRSAVKAIQEEEDQFKAHLKRLLHDANLVVDKNGDRVAFWATIEKERFDAKTFQQDYPELYLNYIRIQLEKRLNIYIKGEK